MRWIQSLYGNKKVKKKDLDVLKRHWNAYQPFLDRYNSMKKGKSTFLIVWKNKKPIGHGRIWWKKIPVIEDMSVDTNYRSKGVGSLLLRRLELYAKRNNFCILRLYVDPNNKKAEKLYLSKGYRFTGETVKDENEMEKIIKLYQNY